LITSSNLIGSWTRSALGSAPRSPTSRDLSTTFSRGMADGPRRSPASLGGGDKLVGHTPTIYLEPFEHDLAARLSGF
jgi:hypothetical protein